MEESAQQQERSALTEGTSEQGGRPETGGDGRGLRAKAQSQLAQIPGWSTPETPRMATGCPSVWGSGTLGGAGWSTEGPTDLSSTRMLARHDQGPPGLRTGARSWLGRKDSPHGGSAWQGSQSEAPVPPTATQGDSPALLQSRVPLGAFLAQGKRALVLVPDLNQSSILAYYRNQSTNVRGSSEGPSASKWQACPYPSSTSTGRLRKSKRTPSSAGFRGSALGQRMARRGPQGPKSTQRTSLRPAPYP
ncbi:hypothetical protein TREES_T100001603 [Tupaia chinensis]|uniref:Uncharacterized protein n=1 Tax=Tupaia chinensis TaxID=246437 RepID=L9KKK9_TUPCH|nr:hypothetical protein TREES_T100001603 [Tupaia chinensis]